VRTLPSTLAKLRAANCADVLACVDGSDYLTSVCEHAAWVCSRCDGKLNLLTVQEPGSQRTAMGAGQLPLLLEAANQVEASGGEVSTSLVHVGAFAAAAAELARPDDMLVVGRRGLSSDGRCEDVGRNIRPLIEQAKARLLICGRVFFPIVRALVLPPLGSGALFADFIASTPLLDSVEADVAVVGERGLEVLRKGGKRGSPRAPLAQRDYDLVLAPRSLLTTPSEHPMAAAAKASLIGRRLVLVV
jgi:hypothetical protein